MLCMILVLIITGTMTLFQGCYVCSVVLYHIIKTLCHPTSMEMPAIVFQWGFFQFFD